MKIYDEITKEEITSEIDSSKGYTYNGKIVSGHVDEKSVIMEGSVSELWPDGMTEIIPGYDVYEDCLYYHAYTEKELKAIQDEKDRLVKEEADRLAAEEAEEKRRKEAEKAAEAAAKAQAEAARIQAEKEKIKYDKIKTPEDRVSFFAQFGWEVNETPITENEIKIPDEFDKILKTYNEVQKQQGLDLTKYRGKTVTRYTYEITNYPNYEGKVYANVLIYKNRVIGGDICSADVNGFIHGFKRQS